MNVRFFSARASLKAGALTVLAALFAAGVPHVARAANGHADPGTQITNSASATYKDSDNNTYTTTSNTLTITVQNAPSMTNIAGTGTNYAPGQAVSDTFVLLNTGNGSGYFQLTADAALGGTDAGFATLGNGAASCTTPVGSQSSPCLYAATVGANTYLFTNLSTSGDNNALNYWLQHTNPVTAANSSVTITVYYTLSASAPAGSSNTVTSSTTANVVYAAAGSAPQETSANQSATESNYVQPEARLELYKASAQNSSTGDITYDVYVHDGGAFAAKDLQSAQTLLGASARGVLITDKVPVFNAQSLHLSNSGIVTVSSNALYGFPSGATADVYYSTSATGAQGSWVKASGNLPTDGSVTYVGLFIHGGTCTATGYDLCADTSHPTSPGNISVLSAHAVTFEFVTVEPSGSGSGQPGAVTNMANGMAGDNMPTEHIMGPGIPALTADGASSAALTAAGQGINNTALTSVAGASNSVANQALGSYSVLIGPLADNASQGSYDSVAAVNTFDDFTAESFGHSGDPIVNTGTVPGTPVTTSTTGAQVTECVGHEMQNDGNTADTFNVTLYAPTPFGVPTTGGQSYGTTFTPGGTQVSGWTVALYSDSACTSLIGGSTPGSASSTASNLSLGSGAVVTLYAGYVIPAGTRYFVRYDALLHAVSNSQSTKVNDTHDDLYSSMILITQTNTVTSTNCPTGATPAYPAGTVCPGDLINYVFDVRNIVLGQSDTNISFNATVADTSNFSNVDDGTISASPSTTTANNWGYFTTGLQAPPVARGSSGAVSPVMWEFAFGTPHGAFSPTFAAGATAFEQVAIAGGQLVPRHYNSPGSTQDWMSTVSFTLIVK
jgi:hypothetical protein